MHFTRTEYHQHRIGVRAYGIPARAQGIRSTRRDPSLRAADVLTARYLAKAQRKGLRASDVAKATGFAPGTVAKHLRAHGLPVGPSHPMIEVDARRLAKLVADRAPIVAIAATFGCSRDTIFVSVQLGRGMPGREMLKNARDQRVCGSRVLAFCP